ncbi:hypothetical protein AVEN_257203-1 [Araneus ventricosus]|uniref:Uncharacterized protein n=1 Tax=Araneus ventricosus TaxID=182803 RepID=A0A4Y2F5A2_ARAVE|nr:hypothetical protein AVEN_257203-1 [Araneus ventricosus]
MEADKFMEREEGDLVRRSCLLTEQHRRSEGEEESHRSSGRECHVHPLHVKVAPQNKGDCSISCNLLLMAFKMEEGIWTDIFFSVFKRNFSTKG